MAARNGVTLKSIVFPRNCRDGLRIARERGLIAFRGNPRVWFNRACPDAEQTLPKRAFRLADTFLPVAGPQLSQPEDIEGMIDVPASRFLRPARGAWHERFQLDRIVGQMAAAAKTNKLFHLWSTRTISAPTLTPTSCSCGKFSIGTRPSAIGSACDP